MKKKLLIATFCTGISFVAMAQENSGRLNESPAYDENAAKKKVVADPPKVVEENTGLVAQEKKANHEQADNALDEKLNEKRKSILSNTELSPEEKKMQLAQFDKMAAEMKAKSARNTNPVKQADKAQPVQATEKKKAPVKP